MEKPEKKSYQNKMMEKLKEEKDFDEQLKEDLAPTDLINSIFQVPEGDKDKILETLFEHPDLRKISDVTPSELIDISVLLTFEKEMGSPLIAYFCETRLALSLSKDRKSRQEIVDIYKSAMYSDMSEMPQREGFLGRMRNRFSGGMT